MRAHRLLDPLLKLELSLKRRRGTANGVLLISAGGLGDTVLLAVVLPRFLALAQPDEPVTVLLRSDAARMGFVMPPGVKIKAVDFTRLRDIGYRRRIFGELHAAHYRLVIHTDYLRHPDLDEALVEACAAREAVAMEPRPSDKHGERLAANRCLYSRLYASGPPKTDKVVRWSAFADFLTGKHSDPPVVHLGQFESRELLPAATVLFQPFSAVKAKQSPPEVWKLIAARLPHGWQVRLAGHPSDLEKNPEFKALLDLPNVSFEGAPFDRLAALIRGCRMVISVDTACMHLAVALGTPTLCLASAAYVGEIVPYAAQVTPANMHVLYTPVECQGCLGNCYFPLEDGMYPCVAALDPDAVLGAVDDIIARGC
ncbi:MAG: glycosyltransferase family 9 protein [Alphaproteobacteria bacterium]|nr:glycosyltransferase family 9 protein [Alphaproteobacteria bacterium]